MPYSGHGLGLWAYCPVIHWGVPKFQQIAPQTYPLGALAVDFRSTDFGQIAQIFELTIFGVRSRLGRVGLSGRAQFGASLLRQFREGFVREGDCFIVARRELHAK